MFDEVLIAGDRLTRTRDAQSDWLSFKVRLPWYRSIYLSCLDRIELSFDGVAQDADAIFFKLYGTTYPFAALMDHHSVLWFVLDDAEILVRQQPGGMKRVNVALTMFFRVPYHRASTFRQVSTCARELPVEERIAL